MKKAIVFSMVLVLALGPLFRGLFFGFEMYLSFAILAALGNAYLFLKWSNKEAFYLRHGSLYCGGALLVAYLLAFVQAVNIRGNIEAVMQVVVYLLLFLVLFDYYREHKEEILSTFFVPITAGGVLAAILGIAGYTHLFTGNYATINSSRIHATLQYANTAAVYFMLVALLLMAMILNGKRIWLKALLAGVGHVLLMALFFTSSRGVFLVFPPIVFLVLFFVMPAGARMRSFLTVLAMTIPMVVTMQTFNAVAQQKQTQSAFIWIFIGFVLSALLMLGFDLLRKIPMSKPTQYCVLALSGIVIIIVGVLQGPLIIEVVKQFILTNIPKNVLNRMQDINLETNSVVMRFEFYKEAWTLIQRQWWFGYGGGGFASLYQSVQVLYYAAKLVHNHYLQIFVESGILGILSFLGLILTAGASMFFGRLKQELLEHRVEAASLLCAFLALSLHSVIDFNLSFTSMGYLLWGMIAIGAAYGVSSRKGEIPLWQPQAMYQWPMFALVTIVGLASVSFSLAGYQMERGAEFKKQIVAVQAITAYEKAARYDPLHAGPHAELADLYSWMAYTSKLEAEKQEWMTKAIAQGERAIRLDRYYPYYNRIMTSVYFSANMNTKAAEQALQLLNVQPLVKANYELVAKGYTEGGLQHYREGNLAKAKEYLLAAVQLMQEEAAKSNKTVAYYAGKAALALADFSQAEQWLTFARSASLELKMEIDRLLYLLNQQTGRSEENAKYKGIIWMGMVESTPVYKELKTILDNGVFQD